MVTGSKAKIYVNQIDAICHILQDLAVGSVMVVRSY